jgi:hypothetical protein
MSARPTPGECTLSTPKHTYDDDGSGIGCDACPMIKGHPIHAVADPRPAIDAPGPAVSVHQSATSQAAGEAARLRHGTLKAQVYEFIRTHPNGATTDEVEVELHRSHQSVSSAVHSLKVAGHITPLVRDGRTVERSTRSGSAAVVYVIAAARVGAA